MRGVVVPSKVRLRFVPDFQYRIVWAAPSSHTNVISVGLASALVDGAGHPGSGGVDQHVDERNSRVIRSRATRAFCCVSTRLDPKRYACIPPRWMTKIPAITTPMIAVVTRSSARLNPCWLRRWRITAYLFATYMEMVVALLAGADTPMPAAIGR